MTARPKRKPLLSRVPADFVRAVLKGHSALGLAFAAVIYLVCLTGSLAVFAREFQRWELADAPQVETIAPQAVQRALAEAVRRAGQGVEHGYIRLPAPDLPQATITIEAKERETVWLVDADGNLAGHGETPWTEFLIRLHVNLHLPHALGVFLVGLTGVALLSSLISGLLAHPRIFRDAFHLRLGGSRRLQEADLHNRIGVWALPFHVIVSLTGALLGLTTLIVGVLGMALFQGDSAKVYELFLPPEPKEDSRPAPVIDLQPLFRQVGQTLAPGARIDMVLLEHPTEMGGAAWFMLEHDNGRLANADSFAFTRDGTLYYEKRGEANNLGESILGSVGKLHFGWFGGGLVKIVYGLLGLGLTYLAAGGVTIWLARRRDKRNPAPRLERLWAATLWSQPVALGAAAIAALIFPAAGTALPLSLWCGLTLILLAGGQFASAEAASRAGRTATGALLIVVSLVHGLMIGGGDPMAWLLDGVMLVTGAALLLRLRAGSRATRQNNSHP